MLPRLLHVEKTAASGEDASSVNGAGGDSSASDEVDKWLFIDKSLTSPRAPPPAAVCSDGAGVAEEVGEEMDAVAIHSRGSDEEEEEHTHMEDDQEQEEGDVIDLVRRSLDIITGALWRPPKGAGTRAHAPSAHHPLAVGLTGPIPAQRGLRVVLTKEYTEREDFDKHCCLTYAHHIKFSFGKHCDKAFKEVLENFPEYETSCRSRPRPGPLMKEFLLYCDIVKGTKVPKRVGTRSRIPDSLTMQDEPWMAPDLPRCPLHGAGTIINILEDFVMCRVVWDTPKNHGCWLQHARWEKLYYIGVPHTYELALYDSASSVTAGLYSPHIANPYGKPEGNAMDEAREGEQGNAQAVEEEDVAQHVSESIHRLDSILQLDAKVMPQQVQLPGGGQVYLIPSSDRREVKVSMQARKLANVDEEPDEEGAGGEGKGKVRQLEGKGEIVDIESPGDGIVGIGKKLMRLENGHFLFLEGSDEFDVLPGDVIMSIDGVVAKGKSVTAIKSLVLGAAGTKVTLVVASSTSASSAHSEDDATLTDTNSLKNQRTLHFSRFAVSYPTQLSQNRTEEEEEGGEVREEEEKRERGTSKR